MSKPVIKEGDISVSIKDVFKRYTLNFTDILKNNNKFYSIELVESSDGKVWIYTSYGRVGSDGVKEYRACSSRADAELEAEKIIKAKTKKGYCEVKLSVVSVGSDIAKSKIESSTLSEDSAVKLGFTIKEDNKSSLHPAIQSAVKNWFGSIEQFVVDTLDTSKCALGQLSLDQINKGRDLLLEARKLVSVGAKDIKSLNDISSKYYSNIPMNFGYSRLDADKLRFDTNDKLDAAFEVLDTLENAKDAEKVLTKKNMVDEQYKSLKTDMEYLDPNDPIFKWIDLLFNNSWSNTHSYLGKVRVKNIFRMHRPNEMENYFSSIEKISSQNVKRKELPKLISGIWDKRVKEDKHYEKYIDSTNILPLFHGTRTENIGSIIKSSLRFRKPGFTVSGSMYDKNGGLYFGFSSKACGYSSINGSYWAKGNNNSAFMFLSDVCLGNQTIATGAYPYTLDKIKPNHSVWAKGGLSGVLNDEFIVYTENQNWLRYVIEVSK